MNHIFRIVQIKNGNSSSFESSRPGGRSSLYFSWRKAECLIFIEKNNLRFILVACFQALKVWLYF